MVVVTTRVNSAEIIVKCKTLYKTSSKLHRKKPKNAFFENQDFELLREFAVSKYIEYFYY